MDGERIVFVDYAKAIGIFLVVFAHCVYEYSDGMAVLCHFIYSFHMPLFFVISGFLLSLKTSGQKNLLKMGKRLLIPYFFWSLVYIALLFILPEYNLNVKERLCAVVTGRGIAPLWFLWDLFFSEVVFVFLFSFLQTNKKRKIVFVLLVLAVVTYGCDAVFSAYHHSIEESRIFMYVFTSITRLVPSVFFMLVGTLFVYVNKACFNKKVTFVLGCLFIALFAIIQIYTDNRVNMHLIRYGNPLVFLMTGSLASIGILLFCKMLPPSLNFVSFIGKKSLDIMILHYPPVPFMGVIALVAGIVLQEKNIYFILLISVVLVAVTSFVGVALDQVRKAIHSCKKYSN